MVVVDASEFIDIGFCSAALDLSGRTWAGHQKGLAFLYRSGGLFADSFTTASLHKPACGKGTACGQGVPYGQHYAGTGSKGFNVTALQHSATELEFRVDGVSQGIVRTKEPMPADLVGCISVCPSSGHAHGREVALSLRDCAK